MKEVLSGLSCADRLCSIVGADGYQYGRTELEIRDALTIGDMRLRTMITRFLAKTAIGDFWGADHELNMIAAWIRTCGAEKAFCDMVNALEFADRITRAALGWSVDADHSTDEAAALTESF